MLDVTLTQLLQACLTEAPSPPPQVILYCCPTTTATGTDVNAILTCARALVKQATPAARVARNRIFARTKNELVLL